MKTSLERGRSFFSLTLFHRSALSTEVDIKKVRWPGTGRAAAAMRVSRKGSITFVAVRRFSGQAICLHSTDNGGAADAVEGGGDDAAGVSCAFAAGEKAGQLRVLQRVIRARDAHRR